MNGGSARLRILYEHASSVGPCSNSFSPPYGEAPLAFFTEKLLALADECLLQHQRGAVLDPSITQSPSFNGFAPS